MGSDNRDHPAKEDPSNQDTRLVSGQIFSLIIAQPQVAVPDEKRDLDETWRRRVEDLRPGEISGQRARVTQHQRSKQRVISTRK